MVRQLISPIPVDRNGEFNPNETIPLMRKLLRITLKKGEVVSGYLTICSWGRFMSRKDYTYCIKTNGEWKYVDLCDVKSYSYMKHEDGGLVDIP